MKAEEEKFGDIFDFSQLYRIKGKQGLWMPKEKPNKSGLIPMVEWLSNTKTHIAKVLDLECLGSFRFYHEANKEPLTIADVMTNLHECEDLPTDMVALMEIMVPNYDPQQFKDYYAKKCLMWYDIISKKLKELKDDGDVEQTVTKENKD